MCQSIEGHLQGVLLIHSTSVGQQNELLFVKFNIVCSVYCGMQGHNICPTGCKGREWYGCDMWYI